MTERKRPRNPEPAEPGNLLAALPEAKGAARPKKVRGEWLRVPEFHRMKHYQSGRESPWIKVHGRWLDDYKFGRLPDALKLQVLLLWMLANRCGNLLPNDAAWLTYRLAVDVQVDVDQLVALGFLEVFDPKAPAPDLRRKAPAEVAAVRPEQDAPAVDASPAQEPEEELDEGVPAAAPTAAADLLTRFRRGQPI